MVAGAVAGVLVRYVMLGMWADETQSLWLTLIAVATSCLILGAGLTKQWPRPIASAVIGFAGALASVSLVAEVAISSRPAVCAAYLILTPVSALVGLGVGLIVGLAGRPKAGADNA
jgi:hypothetical protein